MKSHSYQLFLLVFIIIMMVLLPMTTGHADQIVVTANHHSYRATLAKNSSARALKRHLKTKPVTIKAHDFERMEKVGKLPWSLPQNDTDIHAKPGDIILYQSNQLTLYYNHNEWNFTPIAKIHHVNSQQLRRVLGSKNVNITYSLPR